MEKLLGSCVLGQNEGQPVQVASFSGAGKVVGLYFSAYYCPPCRGFTPKLAEWYNVIKGTTNGDNFEIVFVSSDHDEKSYKEYYGEMPWLSLPFNERDMKAKLSSKFKVQGIPCLVFLNGETGAVISKDGRTIVGEDPTGDQFPWTPKVFNEIIKGKLITNDGTELDESALSGKVVGLYFSAHWCPPCKTFTPELIETYKKINESRHQFAIVYASSDRDESSFNESHSTMPWLALPLKDNRKDALGRIFDVSGIPMLVIVDENGKLITKSGRAAVSKDRDGKEFPWWPQPVNELTQMMASKINEESVFVYFTNANEEEMRRGQDVMADIAKTYHAKGEDQDLFFMYEGEDEICGSLKDFANIDEATVIAIFNVPNQKVYVHETKEPSEITKETIEEFVDKWEKGTLKSRGLKD